MNILKPIYFISSNILIIFFISISLFIYTYQQNYINLIKEEPIAILTFEKIKDNKYIGTLNLKNTKNEYSFKIYGNQWRLDVEFKKFKYYSHFFNIKNKYKLDRIEGRYKNIEDQNSMKTKSYDLSFINHKGFDKLNFLESYLIDTTYGSSIYTDIKEDTIYKIYKTNTGLLTRVYEIEKLKQTKPVKASKLNEIIKIFFNN